MALITCPECNKQISDTAKTCPSCGYDLNTQKNKRRKQQNMRTILLIVSIGLLIGIPIYIQHRNAEIEEASIATQKYFQDMSLPQSYDDFQHIVAGNDPRWELIDQSVENAISINYLIFDLEKRNIPFKESCLYKNWKSYIKGKNK